MYEHTIDSLPYYNSKFHWKKIGINNMILKIDVEHAEWESLRDLMKYYYIIMC